MPGGGLCRVGCGVPPQALCPRGGLRPLPLTPSLSRKGRGGWTGLGPRALGARSDPAAAQPGAPGGGVGAQPPHERTSEGGWVGQSRAARSSGMGVWGAQPPAGDARAAPAPPHPLPLPQGARGPDRPRGLGARSGGLRPLPLTPTRSRKGRGGRTGLGGWGRDPIRRRRSPALRVGAWGRSPHRKKVRGRVGGPEPRSALVRDRGVGGAAPRRRLAGYARSPSPPPSPARGEGAGPASGVGGAIRRAAPAPPHPHPNGVGPAARCIGQTGSGPAGR